MKSIFTALLLLISCTATAQEALNSNALNLEVEIPKDEAVIRGVLDNGLQYYIKENAKPKNAAYMRLIVKTGNLNEDQNQLGLAHLLEHMGFNGTKNFKKDKLVKYIESIGMGFGSDLNASTGNYQTIYKLKVPTQNAKQVDKAFQILEDWAHLMTLEDDAIDAERPVVLEEFRRKLGSSERLRKQIAMFMYEGMPHLKYYSDDKLKHIAQFETSHIRRFYKEWYRPNLMGIVVVGSIDAKHVEQQIKAHFSKLTNPVNEKQFVIQDSVPYHEATRVKVITDPELTQTQLSLHFIDKAPVSQSKLILKHEKDQLLRRMLLSMLNKRLNFTANSTKAPFIGARAHRSSTISREHFMFGMNALSNEDKITEALEAMVVELERVKRFGFTTEELEREKENLEASNAVFLENKDDWRSLSYVNLLSREFYKNGVLYNKDWKYNFTAQMIPNIRVEDINTLFNNYYHKDNRVLLLSAPQKESLKLPTEEELLNVLHKAETTAEITQYQPKAIGNTLIKTLRPKGVIVEEEEKLYDIKRLVLSNGATVLYKKTDFDKETVSFKAVSHGGTSLLTDNAAKTVGPLLSIMKKTGLGGYKPHELPELLTGKKVKLSSRIATYDEGLKGSARTKDLETLFQLIYLNFTGVNKDETTYLAHIDKIKASNKNRKLRPTNQFYEAIRRLRQNGNPRYLSLTDNLERLLDSVPYHTIYETYTERFANAGDFDFIFVGDFDEALLKTYAEVYLAALPSTGEAREVAKIPTFRNSLKDAKVNVYKGLADKATLRIYFEADAVYKKKENAAMKLFGEVFKQRLRSRIREERGGVYTVHTSFKHTKRPFPKYEAVITFDCAPENSDILEQETLQVLEAFLKSGPTKKEIEAVKKKWVLGREKQIEKNSFWLNYMFNKVYWNRPYEPLSDYEADLAVLTPKYIKSVAKKYVSTPSLTAKLLPESFKK
jgi:zinc protease